MLPRFQTRYEQEVVPALTRDFGYNNPLQVPRVKKITLNIGLGEALQNAKAIDAAVADLTINALRANVRFLLSQAAQPVWLLASGGFNP